MGGEGEGRDIAHGFDPRRWGAGSGESAFLWGLGLASGVVAVVAVRNGRLVEVVRVVLVAEAPRRAIDQIRLLGALGLARADGVADVVVAPPLLIKAATPRTCALQGGAVGGAARLFRRAVARLVRASMMESSRPTHWLTPPRAPRWAAVDWARLGADDGVVAPDALLDAGAARLRALVRVGAAHLDAVARLRAGMVPSAMGGSSHGLGAMMELSGPTHCLTPPPLRGSVHLHVGSGQHRCRRGRGMVRPRWGTAWRR